MWNLQSGRQTRCVDYNKTPLHAVAITPDETTVLTSFQIDGQDTIYGIIHWDVATWQRKALQVDDHDESGRVYPLSFVAVSMGSGAHSPTNARVSGDPGTRKSK